MKHYDIAVIGAGVVGGLIARALSHTGLSVCILERGADVALGATKANSAIVHAGFDAKEGTLKARLNVRGSLLMESVCRDLGVKYRRNGSLVIGFDDDDRAALETLRARGVANGVPDLRVIDRDELRALEPRITETATCALYAPTGAIVCPYELCIAAVGNAMDNGADLCLDFDVTALTPAPDGGYTVTSADGRTVSAAYVINAAGLHADDIARLVGDDSFTIHPRRGEYILLDRACGDLVHHTIFRTPGKMGKGVLITPTVDGNLLVGPTSEDIEDKVDKTTTATGRDRLLREAAENLAEGLPFGQSITAFTGLRAVGSTGDFIIRLDSHILHVAAIESPGLSASPAIAAYVLELLEAAGLSIVTRPDANPYRAPAHAFRETTIEEKNAIIARDPTYGRIVCRCEGITEGEILAAMRQNPPARDLDGVKRRTRAGMGRCQGGFCGTTVMELLARTYDMPLEAVTKCGGASFMVVGKTK